MWFGEEAKFAMCVKGQPSEPPHSRIIDVYAAGRWLTCDDNSVYVPHFAGMLESEVGRLLLTDTRGYQPRPYPQLSIAENYQRLSAANMANDGDETDYRRYWHAMFMNWGPTADNVGALLFREADTAYIPFIFWRQGHHDPSELGHVFVAEVSVWELASILHQVAWKLMWEWSGYWASRR
jgi:hypothetical protein